MKTPPFAKGWVSSNPGEGLAAAAAAATTFATAVAIRTALAFFLRLAAVRTFIHMNYCFINELAR